MTPGDRIAQRFLPVGEVLGTSREEGEAPVEARQEGDRRYDLDARGGQLQGQRQAVQALTNLGDSGTVVVRERKVRFDVLRPCNEELNGRNERQLVWRGQALKAWQGEWRNNHFALAAEPQAHPAGHQNVQ